MRNVKNIPIDGTIATLPGKHNIVPGTCVEIVSPGLAFVLMG